MAKHRMLLAQPQRHTTSCVQACFFPWIISTLFLCDSAGEVGTYINILTYIPRVKDNLSHHIIASAANVRDVIARGTKHHARSTCVYLRLCRVLYNFFTLGGISALGRGEGFKVNSERPPWGTFGVCRNTQLNSVKQCTLPTLRGARGASWHILPYLS